MRKPKKFWWDSLRFKGPYFDPAPYLNQKHVKTSGPNKKFVFIGWIAVAIAIVVLVIKMIISN